MKWMALAGIMLVVLGAAALIDQGMTYTRRALIDAGPFDAERHAIPLALVLAVAAVAVGGRLLNGAIRKRVRQT